MPAPTATYSTEPNRRRPRRAHVALAVLLAAGLLGWWKGPALKARADRWYAKRRCAALALPPDRVVYDDDPAAAIGFVPPELAAVDPQPAGTVLFVHARRAKDDVPRLVWVTCPAPVASPNWTPFDDAVGCSAELNAEFGWSGKDRGICTRTLVSYAEGFESAPGAPLHFRIFAGQPDPADESRFTIRFESDGRPGVADGQLGKGGTVTLRLRGGRHAAGNP